MHPSPTAADAQLKTVLNPRDQTGARSEHEDRDSNCDPVTLVQHQTYR